MRPDSRLIKQLHPLKQLQNEHRDRLVQQSQLIQLSMGDELLANQTHHWFLYLVKGRLDLLSSSEPPELLCATDERALHPLFTGDDFRAQLVAQSECQIVRFDKQLFNAYLDEELLTGGELETVEMSEIEGQLFTTIMQAFNAGEMLLPSLPDIAIKIKQACGAPAARAEDIVRIVSADPALAIRLIQFTNGPFNPDLKAVASIHSAIVRIGVKAAADQIISFSDQQPFKSQSSVLNARMHHVYGRAIDVAVISYVLARQIKFPAADQALLAGLLHEVGVMPVLGYIEATGMLLNNDGELDMILDHLRAAVGCMVIQQWNLPGNLLEVIEHYANWERQSEGEVDVCDLVIIAQIYSRLKHHQCKGLPKIEAVPAFKKIFPDQLDKNFAACVLKQSHEEIMKVMTLLEI